MGLGKGVIRSHTLVSNFFKNPIRECHHQQSSSIQYYAFLCYTVSVLQTFTRVVRVMKSVSLRLLRPKVIIFVSMNKGSAGKLEKSFLLIFKLFQFSSGTNSDEIVSDIESNTPLMDDPSVFSSCETERLFGNKFLDALLRETEESDKLARLGCSGGPFNNRAVWGANVNNRGGGGNRFNPYPSQGNRGRG